MNFKRAFKENVRPGAVRVGLTVLIGLVFVAGGWLSNLSYDLLFAFRSPVIPEEVVIVYMDEASEAELKQPSFWRWDRTLHARLLERLKAYHTKAVALDLIFRGLTDTNADAQLVTAARAHGNVVVAAKYAPSAEHGEVLHWQLTRPFDGLAGAAAWGVVEMSDGLKSVRLHYAGNPDQPDLPSFAWQLAQRTYPQRLSEPFKKRWVNYYGPPGTLPHERYLNVLSNEVPVEALSNKVVFVGALPVTGYRAGKGTDDFRTPYTRWTGKVAPGVEVNATTYLNLVRQDWLERLPGGLELGLVLTLGLLVGWGVGCLRPIWTALAGLAASLGLFVAASLVVWKYHFWFDWLVIAGAQIPCAMACAVLGYTQKLGREKLALEARLATLSAAGAPTVGPPAGARGLALEAKTELATAAAATRDVVQKMQERFPSAPPTPALVRPGATAPSAGPPPIPDHVLHKRIGEGAYGEVWLAQSVVGSYHGVKIVYRRNFQDERPYEREFEGIRHFEPISRNHPGLLQILHVGRDYNAGYYYYSMELADDMEQGQTIRLDHYVPKSLAKVIVRRSKLPLAECVEIGLGLSDALTYLHGHGLIHRDIKPGNIIFANGIPKLADIGLVTGIGDGVTFVGTAGFFPPEGPGSPAADVYSLGKVLYEAVTGFHQDRFPDVPVTGLDGGAQANFGAFNKIILKACEPEVKKRYQTAKELHEALVRLQAGDKPSRGRKKALPLPPAPPGP